MPNIVETLNEFRNLDFSKVKNGVNMTKREYFKSLFPNMTKNYFEHIHILCCAELGLQSKCDNDDISCKECWNEEMIKPLPKEFTQPLLDKFNKLW